MTTKSIIASGQATVMANYLARLISKECGETVRVGVSMKGDIEIQGLSDSSAVAIKKALQKLTDIKYKGEFITVQWEADKTRGKWE